MSFLELGLLDFHLFQFSIFILKWQQKSDMPKITQLVCWLGQASLPSALLHYIP